MCTAYMQSYLLQFPSYSAGIARHYLLPLRSPKHLLLIMNDNVLFRRGCQRFCTSAVLEASVGKIDLRCICRRVTQTLITPKCYLVKRSLNLLTTRLKKALNKSSLPIIRTRSKFDQIYLNTRNKAGLKKYISTTNKDGAKGQFQGPHHRRGCGLSSPTCRINQLINATGTSGLALAHGLKKVRSFF